MKVRIPAAIIHSTDKRVMGLALTFALLVWIFDAIMDWLFFYTPESFLDLLLLDIPTHELYIRVLILIMFVIFGIITSIILNHLKKEKNDLTRTQRALRTISNINQVVVHATEETELLGEVCRVIVDSGYQLAWIGFALNDIERTIKPVAYAGFEEGDLESLNLTWADSRGGDRPTGIALRTGKVSITRNIQTDPQYAHWRETAFKWGFGSSIAIPLKREERSFGTLNIYASDPEAFDNKEIQLLTETAADLAFGITTLRSRLEKLRLEKEFNYERANFRSILNSMQDGVYITNKDYVIEFINSVLTDEFGPVEGQTCYEYFHDLPEPCSWCKNKEVFAGKTVRWEWTSPKNQRTYDLVDTPLRSLDGNISKIEIFRDITELKRSSESYQTLFESSPVGIGLSNFKGEFISCNDSMLEIAGYTMEEMHELKLQSSFVNPAVQEELFRLLKDKGRVRNFEAKLKRKTGEVYDASLSVDVIKLGGQELFQTAIIDITVHKRMQEALRKEKEIAQKYLDIAGVMIVVLDKNQKITLINKKGCEILGYEEEEILGRNWFDNFLPLRLRDDVKVVYDQLVTGEVEFSEYYENPVLTKSGEEKIIAWHNSTLYDENNAIIGILSSGEDITELKQKEYQLQGDKMRLELAFKGAGQGIWEWNKKSGEISYDDYWAEVLGYSPGEQIFDIEWWQQKFHPDFIPTYEKALSNYIEGKKEFFELEYKIMNKTGEYIWVWLRGKCVEYDDDQQPVRFIGTHRDITENKRMSEALLESEEKYRNLSERAQDGIVLIQDNLLIYVNPKFCQMLGYTVEELLKTLFTKILHPDVIPLVKDRHNRRMVGEEVLPIYESIVIKKDGTHLNVEINAALISFQNKPADLVIVRDITERKQVEAERLELEQRRLHFNTMTTHELRTPLTIFRGYVEFLQRSGEDLSPKKKTDILQEMRNSCDRLERLISNAGDFTKIERNIFQISLTALYLDCFLQEFVKSSKELLMDQFLFDSTVIETTVQFMGDSDRLRQIIGNLLENAINHTSGSTRKIKLTTEILSEKIRIILSDNGAGIAKENIKKIFEQFVTIPTDFYIGGTGVGLYISRKIAEAHNGTLIAESDGLGKGARFILELPKIIV